MNEPLSRIAKELRRAVETLQYEEVQRRVLAFCEAAEAQARALPPGDSRIGEIATMTQELLQWTHTMVQASRAVIVLQLRQLGQVKRYIPVPTTPEATMRLNA